MIAPATLTTRPPTYAQPQTDPPALKTLLGYATRQQWAIFPCFGVRPLADGAWICTCHDGATCGSPGKHPRYDKDDLPNGLHSASSDPRQIRIWFTRWPGANWARRPEPGTFVIDIDVKPNQDGRAWLATHPIPPTITARRGDGLHLHLAAPAGTPLKTSTGELAAGVDVRSEDGYIMLPPSRHVSGQWYEWEPGASPDECAPALAAWSLLLLVAKLPQPEPPPAIQVGSPVSGSDAGIQDGAYWLGKYTAEANRRRHDACVDLACQLRDNRFSEGDAESLIRQFHSAVAHMGDHPWPFDDALRVLRDIYRSPARQPSNRRQSARPAPAIQDSAPVNPDTGELAGPVDPALVQRLAVQLADWRARAERAEAHLDISKRLWERARRLLSLPNVTNANILRTAFFLLPLLDADTVAAGDPAARVRAKIHEVARLSNQSPVKVGRDIQRMAELDWFEREEVREAPDPLPGQTPPAPVEVITKSGKRTLRLTCPQPPVTHIYIKPKPGFLEVDPTILAPKAKGEWGSPQGKRPQKCEVCGGAVRTHTLICVNPACGHIQPADESAIQDRSPESAALRVDLSPPTAVHLIEQDLSDIGISGVQDRSPESAPYPTMPSTAVPCPDCSPWPCGCWRNAPALVVPGGCIDTQEVAPWPDVA